MILFTLSWQHPDGSQATAYASSPEQVGELVAAGPASQVQVQRVDELVAS